MSPKPTPTPRLILLARRDELARRIQVRDAITIERVADPMDAVQPLVEREAGALAITRATRELAAVDAALERIADGTWGICEDCGREIPALRLQAVPWAAYCTRCAAARERDGR